MSVSLNLNKIKLFVILKNLIRIDCVFIEIMKVL